MSTRQPRAFNVSRDVLAAQAKPANNALAFAKQEGMAEADKHRSSAQVHALQDAMERLGWRLRQFALGSVNQVHSAPPVKPRKAAVISVHQVVSAKRVQFLVHHVLRGSLPFKREPRRAEPAQYPSTTRMQHQRLV
jgi:hypothetical protein